MDAPSPTLVRQMRARLRGLAHRRRSAFCLRLSAGLRLLRPELLSRRAAARARLAGSLIRAAPRSSICSARCWSSSSATPSADMARALPDRRHAGDGARRGRIGRSREPWQLYLADAVLAFGWAGMSLGMITNTLGLWFDRKRGMAISLALNGASFGGIVGVPLLVTAIGHFGFPTAMTVAAARHARAGGAGRSAPCRPPPHLRMRRGAAAARRRPRKQIRACALRDIGFLSVTMAFALVLFAQVGLSCT